MSFVRNFKWIFSVTILIMLILSYKMQFLQLGFDFLGGVRLSIIKSGNEKIVDEVFNGLDKTVFKDRIEVKLSNQDLNDFLNQEILDHSGTLLTQLVTLIEEKLGKDKIVGIDYVGPITSTRLLWSGLWALILSMASMLVYMSFRFQLHFGVCAVLSLMMMIYMSIGIMVIFNMKFDLNVIAALLAVIGYGVNDIIVIFDRIRENLRLSAFTKAVIIDNSIKQTLRRSIFTVLTTLLGNLCIIIFCGDTLRDFGTLIFFGIVASTYISIFLAGPMLLLFSPKL